MVKRSVALYLLSMSRVDRVAVIGGGAGGLASAALLAHGCRVGDPDGGPGGDKQIGLPRPKNFHLTVYLDDPPQP